MHCKLTAFLILCVSTAIAADPATIIHKTEYDDQLAVEGLFKQSTDSRMKSPEGVTPDGEEISKKFNEDIAKHIQNKLWKVAVKINSVKILGPDKAELTIERDLTVPSAQLKWWAGNNDRKIEVPIAKIDAEALKPGDDLELIGTPMYKFLKLSDQERDTVKNAEKAATALHAYLSWRGVGFRFHLADVQVAKMR